MVLPVNTQTGIDAMVGAAQVGQAASSSAANFARAEETYASTALKYAELQQKFQDIETRDMEIDVLKKRQEGALAQAELFTERSVNLMRNNMKMKNADIAKIEAETLTSLATIQDTARQELVGLAEGVDDAMSHATSYQQAAQFLSAIDKTPEDYGIERQYQGTRTVDQWITLQNNVAASGQILEAERLKNAEHKMTMSRDAQMNRYNKEGAFDDFVYKTLLQKQRLDAEMDRARIKALAEGPDPLTRKDVVTLSDKEVRSAVVPRIITAMEKLAGRTLDLGDEKKAGAKEDTDFMARYANEVTLKAQKDVDNQIINHNIDPRNNPAPESIYDAIDRYMYQFRGRIGTDGEVYPEGSHKLRRQKEEWKTKARKSDKYIELSGTIPTEKLEEFLEKAWHDLDGRN